LITIFPTSLRVVAAIDLGHDKNSNPQKQVKRSYQLCLGSRPPTRYGTVAWKKVSIYITKSGFFVNSGLFPKALFNFNLKITAAFITYLFKSHHICEGFI
jgi:hypothetical protein